MPPPTNKCAACCAPLRPDEGVCSRCLGIATHVELGLVDVARNWALDPGAAAVAHAHMTDAVHGIETIILGKLFHHYLPAVPHKHAVFVGDEPNFSHVRVAILQTQLLVGLVRGPSIVKTSVDCKINIFKEGGAPTEEMSMKAQIPRAWDSGKWFRTVTVSGTNGKGVWMAMKHSTSGRITGAAVEKIYNQIRYGNV